MFQFPSHSCSWLSTIPNLKTTVVYLPPKMFFNILGGATMKKFMAKSQPPRQWRETWPRAPGSPYVSFNKAFQPSMFRAYCWFSGMVWNIVPSFTPKIQTTRFFLREKTILQGRETRWTLFLLCFFGMSAGFLILLCTRWHAALSSSWSACSSPQSCQAESLRLGLWGDKAQLAAVRIDIPIVVSRYQWIAKKNILSGGGLYEKHHHYKPAPLALGMSSHPWNRNPGCAMPIY